MVYWIHVCTHRHLLQTADKLTVEVLPLPDDGDIVSATVAAAVVPGGGRAQDDRLQLPPAVGVCMWAFMGVFSTCVHMPASGGIMP